MIKFKSKSESFWMRLIGKLRPDFLTNYWTTVGHTIYYPTSVENPHDKRYAIIIEHETVHVHQYEKLGVPLFLFLYLLIPLPLFFSYFRWRFEREAYLKEINAGASVDEVVNVLWSGYLFPWPKSLMKSWFDKEKI